MNQAELHGVGPRTLVQLRQGLIQGEQSLATLGQEQLKVQSGVADKVQGYLQDVYDAPDEQKLQAQQRAKANAIGIITNTPGLNPYVRSLMLKETAAIPDDAYIGDDRLGLLIGRHNVYNMQLDRARKIAQTNEAAGKGAASFADANKVTGEGLPESPFYSPTPAYLQTQAAGGPKVDVNNQARAQAILAGQAKQAGDVASAEEKARFPFQMQLEQVRQQVAQQFQSNKDAQDKIEGTVLKPYEEKMTSIQQLKSTVQQASQGNVTAARAVALKLIGVTNPDGTKRKQTG